MALADSQFPWGVDELYSYQLESGEFVIPYPPYLRDVAQGYKVTGASRASFLLLK
jgi:hypothetical protein